ncbi:retrovirus-related pol polyprotein from transposon TNT 1-94 [Tanacetum coccineum]
MNRNRKVRFQEPQQPTRMKSSTSDSGSQPSGNTKKNRISQTTNSNQKNKCAKPRSAKSNKKNNWKPTGKVFTSVGYRLSHLNFVKDSDAPQIVTSSEEPIIQESLTPALKTHSDEQIQEDVAELDWNTIMHSFENLEFEETKNHLIEQVIGDPSKPVQTRNQLRTDVEVCMYALTMSLTEPKIIKEAMLDHRWIKSMQDELNQFKRLDVWELVPLPKGRHAFKIDVKTAFLNGPLKEEVFVIHLDGFVNPDFRNHVYRLKKALYGLKQAPRAWKHGMEKCDTVTTPMATAKIDADLQGDKLVSWSSKKQDCTAMSTAEAEYVSLSACCAQVIWMRTQLLNYGYCYNKIPMYYESKSAIAIPCNSIQHSRRKHINIHCRFIKEHVERGTIELYFVRTEYQLANLFTKALPRERFEYLVHRIGMRRMNLTELERLTKLSS